MADKVGGGPNVRDLIRKFEDGSTENSGDSAENKSSEKDTHVIEKGLVAKRTAELEKKTSKAVRKKSYDIVFDSFKKSGAH